MKTILKKTLTIMVVMLLLSGCSHRGIHMSKHRKSRKCNCPTFAERNVVIEHAGEDSVIFD